MHPGGRDGARHTQDLAGAVRDHLDHVVQRLRAVDLERRRAQPVELSGPLAERFRLALHLRRHLVEVGEDGDLGTQDVRDDRREDVVDGLQGIATGHVRLVGKRGHEDDRRVLRSRALADQRRGLEPVHDRHPNVEQDHSEVPGEQVPEGLPARRRLHDVLSEFVEDRLQGDDLLGTVVHDENAGPLRRVRHASAPTARAKPGAARAAARCRSAWRDSPTPPRRCTSRDRPSSPWRSRR